MRTAEAIRKELDSLQSSSDEMPEHFHLGRVGGSGWSRARKKQAERRTEIEDRLTRRRMALREELRQAESREQAARERPAREREKAKDREAMSYWFDRLKVGDILPTGGKVVKKNRKSVITEGGAKWTKHELTGVK